MTRKPTHPIIQALRAARLQQGLTQGAVARRIGVPQNTLWAWEVGRYTPLLDAVAAYAQALGLQLTLTPHQEEGDPTPCPTGSTSSPAHADAAAPAPTKPAASSPAATPAPSAPGTSATTRRTP